VLAPSTVGQIYLMDPRTCEKMAEPFFPPLGGAAQPAWTRPALLGTQQVIAADGVSQVYRLGVKNEPKRHLTVFNKESRTDPIVTPVAVLGNAAFVVDSAGMLTVLALPTLTQAAQQPLTGRVAWGPQTVGNYVFLETDDDQLWCFNSQYQVAWRTPLAYGPLAGPPLAIGENFVLASNRGTLWKVNAAKGNEVGKVDTLLPLATGPVLRGDRLIVGGHDGTLYEVQQP
jgi:outer membrane protein assembly factor BamB